MGTHIHMRTHLYSRPDPRLHAHSAHNLYMLRTGKLCPAFSAGLLGCQNLTGSQLPTSYGCTRAPLPHICADEHLLLAYPTTPRWKPAHGQVSMHQVCFSEGNILHYRLLPRHDAHQPQQSGPCHTGRRDRLTGQFPSMLLSQVDHRSGQLGPVWVLWQTVGDGRHFCWAPTCVWRQLPHHCSHLSSDSIDEDMGELTGSGAQ